MQTPLFISLINLLKKHSDVFCPVMAEVYPMEPKKHVEMCMQTLEDFGFVFPNNIPDVEPKEGLNEEEQMKHYLQTLLDQGHTWDWDHEKAPKYIQENYK